MQQMPGFTGPDGAFRGVKKSRHFMLWPALLVIVLDQVSKWALMNFLRVYESVPVTPFFNLVHVRNRGMAFGILNRADFDLGFFLLVSASLAAAVLLLVWFFKLREGETRIVPGLAMILGGALGNLMDRLRFREVVDFIDLHAGSYHWPAFNVADSAITVGAFWVALCLLFEGRKKQEQEGA